MSYETVIGLEVHLQLQTETKIFCACRNAFGAEPNTQVCPVCLGLPGTLPVLNKKVYEYAIKAAIALDCEIQEFVKFDRKNYYYPDLPKNYQISQYDMPLAYDGKLSITIGGKIKDIGITRIHMEEDAGKLIHDPSRPYSYVDLNRTGTPLLEIVSEPDLRSPEEAYEYLVKLKEVIKYLDISDCNMEEGSLRCDANISTRKEGDKVLGSKVEIKNMNSFKAVRDALSYEEERQREALDDKKRIEQETRLWDEGKGVTISMRSKEGAHDYRYFPEPDLVPFEIRSGLVEDMRDNMPELADAKRLRWKEAYGLTDKDTDVLVGDRELADFFEATAKECGDAKSASNWIRGEVMMHMKERSSTVKGLGLMPEDLAKIIKMSSTGAISMLAAKDVLKHHLDTKTPPEKIVEEKGLKQVSSEDELGSIVDKVISENSRSVNDFKSGKANALSFLVGQVMKSTGGKANPKIAGDMLQRKLAFRDRFPGEE